MTAHAEALALARQMVAPIDPGGAGVIVPLRHEYTLALALLAFAEGQALPKWKDAHKACTCGHALLIHAYQEPHRCTVENCDCGTWCFAGESS